MNGLAERIDGFFGIGKRGSTISTEIKGGIITFLSMAYILSVNPAIISAGALEISWNALFTSTVLAAVVSCLLMGLYAKFPVALAPGMGVNAFLSYTVCIAMEFTYAQALLVVFFSGLLFFVLAVSGARTKIIGSFPPVLRYSFTAGIGFFIALVGLYNAGIVEHANGSALVLGNLSDGTVLLGLFSVAVTLVLWIRKPWGAVLIGIVLSAVVGLAAGYIGLPSGLVSNPDFSLIGETFGAAENFPLDKLAPFVAAVIALAVMDMFDTTGTLLAVADRAREHSELDMKLSDRAMVTDSVATVFGAVAGTSTTTSYLESCTGIESGARTGLMAVTVAALFSVALFFSPVFSIVTGSCLVGALVLVGMLMVASVKNVDWNNYCDVATASVTVFMIGLSGSITDGMALGTVTFILVTCARGKHREIPKAIWVLGFVFVAYFVIYYAYLGSL